MIDQPQYTSAQPGPPPYHQYQHPQPPQFAEPIAPDGRPLAGQGQRLLARIVDSAVYLIATLILGALLAGGLSALLSAVTGDDSPVVPVVAITVIVLLVLGIQYVIDVEIPLRWNGQTPGKRLLKIAVTTLEPGAPLSRGKLTGRLAVMLGCNLASNCFVGILDPLWCLWDQPYRQCLHDKPVKTVVIRLEPAR